MHSVAIYDNDARCYVHAYYVRSLGIAVREFGDQCQDENHPYNKHPESFEMHHVAGFDEFTGEIEPVTPPRPLSKASDHVQKHSPPVQPVPDPTLGAPGPVYHRSERGS